MMNNSLSEGHPIGVALLFVYMDFVYMDTFLLLH